MQYDFTVIGLSAAMLLAIMLLVALKPKPALKVTGICSIITALGGLLIYGYGYAHVFDNLLLAAVRTIWSVCRMFVASNEYSAISSAPLFQHSWAQLLFWCLHFLGFYTTASTALYTLGSGLLRQLRLWLARRSDLHLICGLTEDSLTFAKGLAAQGSVSLVFVDDGPAASLVSAASAIGGICRSDADALAGSARFLKSLGLRPGKRKLTVSLLGSDSAANLRYAGQLLSSLELCGITPQQTSLVIHCRSDAPAIRMQTAEGRYGYGFVTVYQMEDLVARLLVQKYPPCSSLAFTPDGKATEDFEALVIGFGRLGQAVLKQLVMTGQFAGNTFRAAVFAPNCLSVNGYFTRALQQLPAHYPITFHPHDGRSAALYDHLTERGSKLKYIVLCTGSEKLNREIALDLHSFLGSSGLDIPIYQCTYSGICATDPDTLQAVTHGLYQPEVLSTAALDEMAMEVNHYYQADAGTTPLADWMRCDYFSRTSCRAFADNLQAVLRAAHKTADQARSGDWTFTEAHLENLSIMEHRRWCAFHYCMGFSPMSEEEFSRRCDLYRQQLRQGQKPLRISKNAAGKTHACLVEWDRLDALSSTEKAVTGTDPCYKLRDAENVLAVPTLLQAKK